MESATTTARTWLREQTQRARRGAAPVAFLGLTGTGLAIGQAYCAAGTLQAALAGADRPVGLIAAFAGLALLRAFILVCVDHTAFDAGAAGRRRLRTEAMRRLLAAGPAMLRENHSGTLTTTVVDRVEAMDGLFGRWVPALALAVLGPLLVGGVVLARDLTAGFILLGAGLLVPVGMALAGIGAAVASRQQFAAMARLQARFLDRVRGIATIVMAGRVDDEAKALGAAADDLRRRTMRVLRVAFLSSAALDASVAVGLVGIALHFGVGFAGGDSAVPGNALFVLLLVPEFFAPLRGFAAAYQDRMHAQGAASALADLPPAPPPAPVLPIRTVNAQGVTVVFDQVGLSWDPARQPALVDVSFRVPAGETVILAGPSGAGKSTVMEIQLGFVRPQSGRVTINGADIGDLVPAALARLSAWIGQRPVLFAASIRENIRFAKPDASDDELAAAVRAARLDTVTGVLPQGLDTMVGEGGYGLSGGQAQRVAIARAFLKNAPLLLLDEPTAHLDPVTEAEVLDSLRRLTVGRTVILASHSAAAHAFSGRRIDLREGRVMLTRGAA